MRLAGILDHTTNEGGFTIDGFYAGSASSGITLRSAQGGLSGIVHGNIGLVSHHGSISGQSAQDINLEASGSFTVYANNNPGRITFSGIEIHNDALDLIHDLSAESIYQTSASRLQILAGETADSGAEEKSVIIKASENIDNRCGGTFNVNSVGETEIVCNNLQLNPTFHGSGLAQTFWGFRAPNFVHLQTTEASARILLTSDRIRFDAGYISGTATSFIGLQSSDFLHLRTTGGSTSRFRTDTGRLELNSSSYTSGVAASFIGLSANNLLHLEARQAAARILINSNATIRIHADQQFDITTNLGSFSMTTGSTTLQGPSARINSSTQGVIFNSASFTTERSATSHNIETLNGDITSRPTQGKFVFTKVDQDQRAPINISGVSNVISNFRTSESAGDLGFTSPSSDVNRGAGQLWLSTGSGIAPISIGSGIAHVYNNNTTEITTTGGSYTNIEMAVSNLRDRQYQRPDNFTIVPTQNGLYRVSYNASLSNVTTTFNSSRLALLVNGSVATPSTCEISIPSISLGGASNGGSVTLLFLNAGDQLTMGGSKIVGTGATISSVNGGCWVLIERIRGYI